jgi:hypothetical protein
LPVEPGKQFVGSDAEGARDLDQRVDAGDPDSPLEHADLGAMEIGAEGEGFLR